MKQEVKAVYFDMDGTIADLYSVKGWLKALRGSNPAPYAKAKPMADMEKISYLCNALQVKGVKIGIITWLSMESSKEYKRKTRQAKRNWLKQHFPLVFDEVHMVQYGYSKRKVAKEKNSILFDDNKQVRKEWQGRNKDRIAIHPDHIIGTLEELLRKP